MDTAVTGSLVGLGTTVVTVAGAWMVKHGVDKANAERAQTDQFVAGYAQMADRETARADREGQRADQAEARLRVMEARLTECEDSLYRARRPQRTSDNDHGGPQ